jgi:acyl-CoA thioester hydrolase
VNGWLIESGVLDIYRGAQIGLVVETGCRYFAEMAFPDTIHAGIRVAKLGNSSVRYEIGLFRNDEDEAAAEGFFVHVYVDAGTRRPAPLDPGLRTLLESIAS